MVTRGQRRRQRGSLTAEVAVALAVMLTVLLPFAAKLAKDRVEGRSPTVDTDFGAAYPQVGVDGESEVDRCCAEGQLNGVAVRCENVDLVWEQVELQVFNELFGVPWLALPVEQLAEPRHVLV